MGNAIFRNPDKFQVLPFREWLRNRMPNGSSGFVVEDLDLVIRWFGRNFGYDSAGAFILIDLKFGRADLGMAQVKTFGLLDKLLRTADPGYERYLGFYLVQYDNEDWEKANFRINYHDVTRDEFSRFWHRKYILESYFE